MPLISGGRLQNITSAIPTKRGSLLQELKPLKNSGTICPHENIRDFESKTLQNFFF